MAVELQPFTQTGDTLLIAATTVSGTATLPAGAALTSTAIRVYNDGPSLVFITVGRGSATASIRSIPVASGNTQLINKGANDTVAAVTLATMANVYITPGFGITT